ncbi:hypothetical protein EGW08_017843 [Elysia chlorotica]|uniref:Uncharacterized protein n=1 Tax=Elysia chlorotica TaxID=188477 RepID=A0A3S0ZC87_ELYCH|nr:hypothetical protein EGW08_017843 [Elysia chlorotica]
MFKSKEDDESFNNVDVERKELDKMELPNLSPYKQEDEVDETGEEGSEVYFAKSYLPVDSYDNVPLKDSLTESVDKYSDAEFEDDSMGTSRVNTYDSDLQDINFHADSDLVKNYKTSLNLRHFLPETLQPTDPKFGRIEDGLAGDVRLGPGELVDEEDNPIYAPDRNYPLTGPNAGPEVGSLAFWSKEIRKLDESDKRNQILASKLRREFIGEEEPGDLPVNGDIVFPDAGEKGGEHSLPRVSDLFSEQVRSIIRDTQGKDNTVKSDRKQLPPWMKDFSFGADVSDESELERRREDELARLINPGIDVLLKRAEKKYAHQKPTGQDFKDVNKIVLSLLDDVPVNPDEFEYQKGLADVSVYTKPVDSNPDTLEDRKPKDELALKAIEGLDNAAKTLEQIQEDMKARQREKLKSELKDAENVRREMKIHEEKKRMEDMLGHIKAIPKMEAVAKDLGKKRVQQYKHLMNSLRQAYGERVKNQKKNLKTYNKLSKKMEKIQEEVDDIASESEPIT